MISITLQNTDIRLTATQYLGDRYFDFTKAIQHVGGWSIPNSGRPYYLVPLSRAQDCLAVLDRIAIPYACDSTVTSALSVRDEARDKHLKELKAFVRAYNAKLTGLTIRNHQEDDIARVHVDRVILLANPVGSGKTMVALLSVPSDHKVIIVCPSNVREAWVREISKWKLGLESDCEIMPTKLTEWSLSKKRFSIYSCSSLPSGPCNFPCSQVAVLVDEAHEYLNYKSQRNQKLRVLTEAVANQDGMLVALSASPIKNKYGDLLTFLETFHLLKKSFGSRNNFFSEFRASRGQYGIEWGGPLNPTQSREKLDRVMIRREREEIITELPDYSFDTLPLTLTRTELRKLSSENADLALDYLEQGLDSLRGPAFELLSAACSALAQVKARHLVPIIQEYLDSQTPLVVMSRSKQALKALQELLPKGSKVAMLTGDQSTPKRERIRQDFFAGKYDVVLCTIAACYQGIDLTKAYTMLFLDRDFVPEINMQCRGRIDRLTQKSKGLRYIYAVANHALDSRLDEILTEKERMLATVYDR